MPSKSDHFSSSWGQDVVTTRNGPSTSNASTIPSFLSTWNALRTVPVLPLPGGRNSLAPPCTMSFIPRTCSGRGSNGFRDFFQGDSIVIVNPHVGAHGAQNLVDMELGGPGLLPRPLPFDPNVVGGGVVAAPYQQPVRPAHGRLNLQVGAVVAGHFVPKPLRDLAAEAGLYSRFKHHLALLHSPPFRQLSGHHVHLSLGVAGYSVAERIASTVSVHFSRNISWSAWLYAHSRIMCGWSMYQN